jgi:hypothetical protein
MISSDGALSETRIVAQVAEPKHRLDAIGDAAGDSGLQHSPPCIAPEISILVRDREKRCAASTSRHLQLFRQ